MYHLKNINVHEAEIVLPKCMYTVKNIMKNSKTDDTDIKISDQVIKFLKSSPKMTELEQRQDQLLKKLDTLYDKIKAIGSHCDLEMTKSHCKSLPTPEEVVLVVSPDSLPWYINVILKHALLPLNLSWHIHSSVPSDKIVKIQNFIKNLKICNKGSAINLRLIFKCVSADTELKLSSLAAPIVGNVNILRYLSYVYPDTLHYDSNDYNMDYLLDICHLLERSVEKNKEALFNKLCAQGSEWLCGNKFTIVDITAYNAMKQYTNVPKYVPKKWFEKCEQICL